MFEPQLLEQAASNWLWTVAKDLVVRHRDSTWPDFELQKPNGGRLLLEIKGQSPTTSRLNQIARRFGSESNKASTFLLVTPKSPSPEELAIFRDIFGKFGGRADWTSIDSLPNLLGRPSPGRWESPQTLSLLQKNALLKGIEEYRSAPVGPAPYASEAPANQAQALARQLPYEVVGKLVAKSENLELELGLGARREATIVLSDIVNFSSLVTASRPDDLRATMGEYYQKARQAVFDHGGMLDKFIGDAVLAVFGYPDNKDTAPVDAIRYAISLVGIGREVLGDWQAELNAVIATGTRVGIATGDIWPINIGQGQIEISLLGDTINLAARLEKNCEVDKFLTDNRTHTAAQRIQGEYVESLNLVQMQIAVADAKGQAFPTRAWTPRQD